MTKLSGFNKLKSAVFISGTGSNLQKLIEFSLLKKSPIEITFVLSDKKNAKGLRFSKKYKIESKIYNFQNKSIAENKILDDLKKKKIKLICLAGFMKILSKNFIEKFNGKILNIHPSLLPKYKGLDTHKRVIQNKEKYSGCTVHLVNSKLDSGKIIMQKKIKIFRNDTSDKIAKRILKQEHLLYPKALKKVLISL